MQLLLVVIVASLIFWCGLVKTVPGTVYNRPVYGGGTSTLLQWYSRKPYTKTVSPRNKRHKTQDANFKKLLHSFVQGDIKTKHLQKGKIVARKKVNDSIYLQPGERVYLWAKTLEGSKTTSSHKLSISKAPCNDATDATLLMFEDSFKKQKSPHLSNWQEPLLELEGLSPVSVWMVDTRYFLVKKTKGDEHDSSAKDYFTQDELDLLTKSDLSVTDSFPTSSLYVCLCEDNCNTNKHEMAELFIRGPVSALANDGLKPERYYIVSTMHDFEIPYANYGDVNGLMLEENDILTFRPVPDGANFFNCENTSSPQTGLFTSYPEEDKSTHYTRDVIAITEDLQPQTLVIRPKNAEKSAFGISSSLVTEKMRFQKAGTYVICWERPAKDDEKGSISGLVGVANVLGLDLNQLFGVSESLEAVHIILSGRNIPSGVTVNVGGHNINGEGLPKSPNLKKNPFHSYLTEGNDKFLNEHVKLLLYQENFDRIYIKFPVEYINRESVPLIATVPAEKTYTFSVGLIKKQQEVEYNFQDVILSNDNVKSISLFHLKKNEDKIDVMTPSGAKIRDFVDSDHEIFVSISEDSSLVFLFTVFPLQYPMLIETIDFSNRSPKPMCAILTSSIKDDGYYLSLIVSSFGAIRKYEFYPPQQLVKLAEEMKVYGAPQPVAKYTGNVLHPLHKPFYLQQLGDVLVSLDTETGFLFVLNIVNLDFIMHYEIYGRRYKGLHSLSCFFFLEEPDEYICLLIDGKKNCLVVQMVSLKKANAEITKENVIFKPLKQDYNDTPSNVFQLPDDACGMKTRVNPVKNIAIIIVWGCNASVIEVLTAQHVKEKDFPVFYKSFTIMEPIISFIMDVDVLPFEIVDDAGFKGELIMARKFEGKSRLVRKTLSGSGKLENISYGDKTYLFHVGTKITIETQNSADIGGVTLHLEFKGVNLPKQLTVDSSTGLISGTFSDPIDYTVLNVMVFRGMQQATIKTSIQVVCSPGKYQVSHKCVNCRPGTFLDTERILTEFVKAYSVTRSHKEVIELQYKNANLGFMDKKNYNGLRIDNLFVCEPCGFRKTTLKPGASSKVLCVCNQGFETTEDPYNRCRSCNRNGSFRTDLAQTFCRGICPPNAYPYSVGAVKLSEQRCVCLPGYYASNDRLICLPCERGFYCEGGVNDVKRRCPPNTTSNSGASSASSISDCFCRDGFGTVFSNDEITVLEKQEDRLRQVILDVPKTEADLKKTVQNMKEIIAENISHIDHYFSLKTRFPKISPKQVCQSCGFAHYARQPEGRVDSGLQESILRHCVSCPVHTKGKCMVNSSVRDCSECLPGTNLSPNATCQPCHKRLVCYGGVNLPNPFSFLNMMNRCAGEGKSVIVKPMKPLGLGNNQSEDHDNNLSNGHIITARTKMLETTVIRKAAKNTGAFLQALESTRTSNLSFEHCPANTESIPGMKPHGRSPLKSVCLCKEGFYYLFINENSYCSAAQQGYYKSGLGNLPQTKCPGNSTTTGTHSVHVDDCFCEAGSYWELSDESLRKKYISAIEVPFLEGTCTPCPKGFFCEGGRNRNGHKNASSCALLLDEPGASTENEGSINSSSCVCGPGYEAVRGRGSQTNLLCRACAMGKYKPFAMNVDCSSCIHGTHENVSKLTGEMYVVDVGVDSPFGCSCPPGYEVNPALATSNKQAVQSFPQVAPCKRCTNPYTYCSGGVRARKEWSKNLLLPPSLAIAIPGKSCPKNSIITNSLHTSIRDCYCEKGYGAVITETEHSCVECEPGTYKSVVARTQCTARCGTHFTSRPGAVRFDQCYCEENYHLLIKEKVCAQCPLGAQCDGGVDEKSYNQLERRPDDPLSPQSHLQPYPKKNFYMYKLRPQFEETNDWVFFRCPVDNQCYGGINNRCVSSMESFLCGNCRRGYSKTFRIDKLCGPCPPLWLNFITHISYYLALVFLCIFLTYLNVSDDSNTTEIHSIIIKIGLNFVSCLTVFFSVDLSGVELPSWSADLAEFMTRLTANTSIIAASEEETLPTVWMSLDCLISHYRNYTYEETFFVTSVINALMPVILPITSTIIMFIIITVIKHKRRDQTTKKLQLLELVKKKNLHELSKEIEIELTNDRIMYIFRYIPMPGTSPFQRIGLFFEDMIPVYVTLLFFFQSTASANMLKLLQCKYYHNSYKMIILLSMQCYTKEYTRYFILGIAGVCAWGLGIPIVSFYILFKNRHRLSEKSIRLKYGFLHNGYEKSHWYWESVVYLRKIALLLAAIIDVEGKSEIKILTAMGVGVIFLHLQLSLQPFDKRNYGVLDKMENRSITVFTFSMVLTQILLTFRFHSSVNAILYAEYCNYLRGSPLRSWPYIGVVIRQLGHISDYIRSRESVFIYYHEGNEMHLVPARYARVLEDKTSANVDSETGSLSTLDKMSNISDSASNEYSSDEVEEPDIENENSMDYKESEQPNKEIISKVSDLNKSENIQQNNDQSDIITEGTRRLSKKAVELLSESLIQYPVLSKLVPEEVPQPEQDLYHSESISSVPDEFEVPNESLLGTEARLVGAEQSDYELKISNEKAFDSRVNSYERSSPLEDFTPAVISEEEEEFLPQKPHKIQRERKHRKTPPETEKSWSELEDENANILVVGEVDEESISIDSGDEEFFSDSQSESSWIEMEDESALDGHNKNLLPNEDTDDSEEIDVFSTIKDETKTQFNANRSSLARLLHDNSIEQLNKTEDKNLFSKADFADMETLNFLPNDRIASLFSNGFTENQSGRSKSKNADLIGKIRQHLQIFSRENCEVRRREVKYLVFVLREMIRVWIVQFKLSSLNGDFFEYAVRLCLSLLKLGTNDNKRKNILAQIAEGDVNQIREWKKLKQAEYVMKQRGHQFNEKLNHELDDFYFSLLEHLQKTEEDEDDIPDEGIAEFPPSISHENLINIGNQEKNDFNKVQNQVNISPNEQKENNSLDDGEPMPIASGDLVDADMERDDTGWTLTSDSSGGNSSEEVIVKLRSSDNITFDDFQQNDGDQQVQLNNDNIEIDEDEEIVIEERQAQFTNEMGHQANYQTLSDSNISEAIESDISVAIDEQDGLVQAQIFNGENSFKFSDSAKIQEDSMERERIISVISDVTSKRMKKQPTVRFLEFQDELLSSDTDKESFMESNADQFHSEMSAESILTLFDKNLFTKPITLPELYVAVMQLQYLSPEYVQWQADAFFSRKQAMMKELNTEVKKQAADLTAIYDRLRKGYVTKSRDKLFPLTKSYSDSECVVKKKKAIDEFSNLSKERNILKRNFSVPFNITYIHTKDDEHIQTKQNKKPDRHSMVYYQRQRSSKLYENITEAPQISDLELSQDLELAPVAPQFASKLDYNILNTQLKLKEAEKKRLINELHALEEETAQAVRLAENSMPPDIGEEAVVICSSKRFRAMRRTGATKKAGKQYNFRKGYTDK